LRRRPNPKLGCGAKERKKRTFYRKDNSLSHIARVIKSKMIKWPGYVARIGRCEMYTKFKLENLKGRGHLEDLGVNGRIILEWILEK
jgi:hypothetical protein